MSVLIKSIDKPKNSRKCPFAVMAEDWEKECIVGGEYHWDNERVCEGCPLVEVPTPHGPLIDGDELSTFMYHHAFELDSADQRWDSGCWIRYRLFENAMKAIPTIIEAEEGVEA